MLQITPSERAVLQLLADGHDASRIARRLGIREIDAYLSALFAKLGTSGRSDAVAAASRRGLVVTGPNARPARTLREQ